MSPWNSTLNSRSCHGRVGMLFKPGREFVEFLGSVFKRHCPSRHRQSFRLCPVQTESHLLIDPGLLMVIIGLRRGAFHDHGDLDSLLSGREIYLRWKDAWLKRPVFCAATPRGLSLDLIKPMRYQGFTDFLKTTCANAGLGGASLASQTSSIQF